MTEDQLLRRARMDRDAAVAKAIQHIGWALKALGRAEEHQHIADAIQRRISGATPTASMDAPKD